MKRQAEHPARCTTLFIKDIERITDRLAVLVWGKDVSGKEPAVVETLRVGHCDHSARLNPHWDRLIVAPPIAEVVVPLGGQVVWGLCRLGQCWAQPSSWRNANRRCYCLL